MSEMLRKAEGNRDPNGNRDHVGRKSIMQELAGLTVVVVAPGDDQTSLLIRELQRLRITPRQIWPLPDSVPSDADVVYCEYSTDLALRLP